MTEKQNYSLRLICPWCQKGAVLTQGRANVRISVQCSKCGRFYSADLNTMETQRTSACRRAGEGRTITD